MSLRMKLNPVVFQEDETLVKRSESLLKSWTNQTIMVVGATGLIGQGLIHVLLVANERLDLKLKIIGVARNREKVAREYANLLDESALTFIYQTLDHPFDQVTTVDLIFHTAAVTDGRVLTQYPVESFESQLLGMTNVLQLAKRTQARVVYLSSMEIYGQPFVAGRATEKDLGYVDPLVLRNGYPESKRANEFLASAYHAEYGVWVVNARLAQTFGPGVAEDDHRVFAQFARSAIAGKDIVLQTDGTSMGNYAYLYDTIAALFLLSEQGQPGESYNVVNEATTVSIKHLAQIAASLYGNSDVVIRIPDQDPGYAPKVALKLSGQKLLQLGWQPTLNLKQMFEKLIASWEADTNGK